MNLVIQSINVCFYGKYKGQNLIPMKNIIINSLKKEPALYCLQLFLLFEELCGEFIFCGFNGFSMFVLAILLIQY